MPKLKVSDTDEVKTALKSAYKTIREVYKYYSAVGLNGSVFGIGLNSYTDFLKEELQIIDGTQLKYADTDRLFITVNAGNKVKNSMIPANSLVRYQFMEILMRLAIKKYYDSG